MPVHDLEADLADKPRVLGRDEVELGEDRLGMPGVETPGTDEAVSHGDVRATTRIWSLNLGSLRLPTLFNPLQAAISAITSVFPDPVAILTAQRVYASPDGGTLIPTLRSAEASVRKTTVSTASCWQKKGRVLLARRSSSNQWRKGHG